MTAPAASYLVVASCTINERRYRAGQRVLLTNDDVELVWHDLISPGMLKRLGPPDSHAPEPAADVAAREAGAPFV